MKGFVLAAGFGRRLSPITDSVPKPLLPVGNLPLIGFALRLLAHHAVCDVIVNLHHLGKLIREALGDGAPYGVRITYSEEEEILGTGGGMRRMRHALEDGPFVALNSDTIIDLDLARLIDEHLHSGALATLVLREDPRQEEFGLIEIDGSGRVRRLLGQGQAKAPLRALMFAGVHIIHPRLLDYIPDDVNTCIMRYAYSKALANGELLRGVVASSYWNDAGTPERYLQANFDVLDRKVELPYVDPLSGYALEQKRAVVDVVRMGENVHLGTGTSLRPPVLLGDAARVGDEATVGPFAVLGARVHVGKQARVTHSVLLDGVRVEAGAEVHHAIVGKKDRIAVKQPRDGP